MAQIPLVDLQAQHAQIRDELEPRWQAVLDRTAFVGGDEVAAFESEFAAFSSVAHCIGVANGTDALELSVRALGLGPGDEVVLPANTFVASAMAVVRAGATPVLVDVDRATQLIDPRAVEAAIGPRTRAIMAVDLFGQVAPMAALEAVADRHELFLIEDAAQSQGARQDGRVAGGFGHIAGTSFYPGKNLGAYGDGGAVLTNDDDLAERVRGLRNYGSEVKYHHPEIGFNSRLDTLQAVVLSCKLRLLAGWNEQRRAAADRYDDLLQDLDEVVLPVTATANVPVWHLYVVRVANRDRVLAALHDVGIGAGIHYPVPIHLQGAFRGMGLGRGAFPEAERCADEILSLPMFAEITPGQQLRVVEALSKAVR